MSSHIIVIGLVLLSSATEENHEAAKHPAETQVTQPASPETSAETTTEAQPANRPPPSKYDLTQPQTDAPPLTEEQSLLVQLGRTVLSLGLVVALIYLIAKLIVPRLGSLRTGSRTGQLELLERVQLDPKHAIFLVQIGEKNRVLLGGGDGSLRFLTHLEHDESSFGEALEKVQKAAVDSTRADAIQDTSG